MALIFKKLHKEDIEWVLQVEQISNLWTKYIKNMPSLKGVAYFRYK